MSSETAVSSEPLLVCEFCGFPIEESDQECAALDEGICAP